MPWYHGRGNVRFATDDAHAASTVQQWADRAYKYLPPQCYNYFVDEEIVKKVVGIVESALADKEVQTAFPVEMNAEEVETHHIRHHFLIP